MRRQRILPAVARPSGLVRLALALAALLAAGRPESGEREARERARLARRIAEGVRSRLGLAISVERLLGDDVRRLRRQDALLGAARALASELEFEDVVERLVREAVSLLDADAADLSVRDDAGVLRRRAGHGVRDGERGQTVAVEGAVATALRTGRAARERRLAGERPPPGEEVAATPILDGDDVRAVLRVFSRRTGFGDADLALLEALALLASIALRNADVLEERSRQARVQGALSRTSSALGRPLSLAATLDAVARAAADALGGSFAAVLLTPADGVELACSDDVPDVLRAALAAGLPPSEAALAGLGHERHILAAPDVRADARFGDEWRELARRSGYRSLLAIPVEHAPEKEANAVALVFFVEERRFGDDDIELAQHVAEVASGALERARLYEEERRGRSLAQQLARTARLLATELDPAAVVEEVVRQAPGLVGADAGALRLAEGDDLVITAVEADERADLLGERSPTSGWLSGDVAQSRTPLALANAGGDERLRAADPLLRLAYAAYLGVPLVGPEGSLLGVLSVYARRPKPWRSAEVDALVALAATASAALSNAELYQRVALEKERSQAILANVGEGIVAVDREGRVVLWNTAAERITGVRAADAVGRPPRELLGRELEQDGGARGQERVVRIFRGGDEVFLSLTEAVMRDPAGSVAGRIYAFRDVSAELHIEELKSEFVSTVSQELRRPLTSIYGFAATLLREDVAFGDEERRTFLRYIASETERLAAIVDQLLNVARLESGDLELRLATADVRPLVADVVAAVEATNEHRFVLDVPDEPLAARVDPQKLRQVLANLIDNAVKFSPEGGRVTVSARRRRDRVEVTVADEGAGVGAHERERIFRKFYRGEAGTARAGTGVGLFIAHGLVAAMGGRIWVTSGEGEGARFTFELPLAAPSEA